VKYRATLERTSDASAVRTPTVSGVAEPPAIGRSFLLVARGLTPGLPYRHVITSRVVSMSETMAETERTYELRTETGSLYRVMLDGPPVGDDEIDALILS
jgi:hypothetical protein